MTDIPVHLYHPPPDSHSSSALPSPPHQPQLPTPPPTTTTVKLKACAGCRLRRVKCERDGGQTECRNCLARSLVCKPFEPKEKGGLRNGKRVKQAKELYGRTNDGIPTISSSAASSSSGLTIPSSDSCSNTESLLSKALISIPIPSAATPYSLSSTSPDSRLSTVEVKANMMGSLMDSFFTFKSVITFDGDLDFLKTFNLAGRRIDQLSPSNQVLCGALLALGARCSDHPGLVGSSGSHIIDLSEATKADVDLRPFGAARSRFVAELQEDALKLADEKGVMRMVEPESVAALMLLEGMMELTDEGFQRSHAYATAYKSQIRTLLASWSNDKSSRSVQGSIMSWTAYARDSLTAAMTGMTPAFSDDDAFLLRGEDDPPPQLEEALLRPLLPHPPANFWTLLDSYVHHLTDLARACPAHLTGPRASKAAKLNEGFFKEAMEKLHIALNAVPTLQERANIPWERARFRQDALSLVRTLRLSACHLTLLFRRVLAGRLKDRPGWSSLTRFANFSAASPLTSSLPINVHDEYWTRLERLNSELDALVFRAGRDIVANLADVLSSGIPLGTHQWLDARSMELLFARLPVWAEAIIHTPTVEEGGSILGFDHEAKISDLRWMLRALRSVGWASETLVSSYDWLSTELLTAEGARDAFYFSTSPFPSFPLPHDQYDTLRIPKSTGPGPYAFGFQSDSMASGSQPFSTSFLEGESSLSPDTHLPTASSSSADPLRAFLDSVEEPPSSFPSASPAGHSPQSAFPSTSTSDPSTVSATEMDALFAAAGAGTGAPPHSAPSLLSNLSSSFLPNDLDGLLNTFAPNLLPPPPSTAFSTPFDYAAPSPSDFNARTNSTFALPHLDTVSLPPTSTAEQRDDLGIGMAEEASPVGANGRTMYRDLGF